MASTLQLVLAVLWLAVALICSLLMILTPNKRRKQDDLMFFFLLGSGFSPVLYNVSCRVVPSLL